MAKTELDRALDTIMRQPDPDTQSPARSVDEYVLVPRAALEMIVDAAETHWDETPPAHPADLVDACKSAREILSRPVGGDEPTPEMIEAGAQAINDAELVTDAAAACYRVMRALSQSPQGE